MYDKYSKERLARLLTINAAGMDMAVQGMPFGPERLSVMHKTLTDGLDPEGGKFRDPRIPGFLENIENRMAHKNGLKGASHYETVTELTQCFADLARVQPFNSENNFIAQKFLSDIAVEAGHALDWSQMEPNEWQKSVKEARDGNTNAAKNMLHRVFQDNMPAVKYGAAMMDPSKLGESGSAGKPNPEVAKKMASRLRQDASNGPQGPSL